MFTINYEELKLQKQSFEIVSFILSFASFEELDCFIFRWL